MELNEFITEIITQIEKGLNEAGKTKTNMNINPECKQIGSANGLVAVNPIGSASLVKFKIELCQNEGKEEKTGVGVFFANTGIGYNNNSASKLTSFTSVEFTIPIEFSHIHNNS